ncbi:n-acetyltransferase domain-containing protein [Trichonephila clavata]|uniref:N-acetyltransferase domain-containing protein n=1 Tax=Trichonephila clavata TaxID=2740835 RepID=A0A8X6KGL1_TRICU|nr:n-acetyltransferase domain-containing protein [Trichonephila clavata]
MLRIMKQNARLCSNFTRGMKENAKKDPNTTFRIRPMRIEEIPQVVELVRPHHFHFPASALKFWHLQDRDGMRIAVTDSGQIIGSLCTVKNTENLYSTGSFCVHENYRHLDLGRKLIKETLSHYQVNPSILSDELPSGVAILPFQNSLLPAILEYDYSLIGYERRLVIEASCKEENGKTLVAMKDGKCVGLGSIKLNINEQGRIGPLYADYPSVAEALVKWLITAMPEAKGFAIVTINTNMFANMILDKLSIPVYKPLYRLYTKEGLHVDTEKVFAHLDVDFNSF